MLTTGSRLRYYAWRLGCKGGVIRNSAVSVRLANGFSISVRPREADLSVACEVFANQTYRPPISLHAADLQTIVDCGANVGYATLYLAHLLPQARIVAYEPVPAHVDILRRHVDGNRLANRVRIVPEAAWTKRALLPFFESDNRSSLLNSLKHGEARELSVQAADFLQDCRELGRIDLLKMDIEGSEYPILLDGRFGELDIRNIVVEWHRTAEQPDGKDTVITRLRSLNFDCTPVPKDGPACGLIWGRRRIANSL
jgi:FkbM family methyltransferase